MKDSIQCTLRWLYHSFIDISEMWSRGRLKCHFIPLHPFHPYPVCLFLISLPLPRIFSWSRFSIKLRSSKSARTKEPPLSEVASSGVPRLSVIREKANRKLFVSGELIISRWTALVWRHVNRQMYLLLWFEASPRLCVKWASKTNFCLCKCS